MNDTNNQDSRSRSRRTEQVSYVISVIAILFGAFFLRTYHIDWDAGTHVHPDERYLTMVVSAIQLPSEALDDGGNILCDGFISCLGLYLDTSKSPANPANLPNYASYVYGTLPLNITRYLGLVVEGACHVSPDLLSSALSAVFRDSRITNPCQQGLWIGYNGIHIVGRLVSALLDVTTVLAVISVARVLRGRTAALLAGVFYAMAALPIQHSHFFVVDNLSTAFTAWTLYLCIRALQRRQLWALSIAGITTGLAVACKISVWPLAIIVAVSGLVYAMTNGLLKRSLLDHKEQARNPQLILLASVLMISGLLAAITFRIAQPYAFAGPGFFGLRINQAWLSTMRESQELASGLRDVPFGHQWTARTPVVFPLANMVFWGLGLPLGITAWLGWFYVGWGILKNRKWQDGVLWLWGTGYFLYQGTQWVKSMRYILPVYPVFVVFASIFLVDVAEGDFSRLRPGVKFKRLLAIAARGLTIVVVLGTAFWAAAFLRIYREPLTRISASQWMYENIPTAVTAITTESETVQIPIRQVTLGAGQSILPIPLPQELSSPVSTIVINKLFPVNEAGPRTFSLSIEDQSTSVTVDLTMGVAHRLQFDFEAPVAVLPDAIASATLELLSGGPVLIDTTVIANEHWDDPLPLRVDGKDPFWNWYRSLTTSDERGQMNNYDNDTLEKRTALLSWLDEADIIALSSNRLYASIPRLPMRYPFTTEYYRVLFSGELGFELAAEFVSYPQVGAIQFPDQEIPFDVIEPQYSNAARISVPYPPAEEAYSVYDHPTVLLFRKTSAYSRQNAERLLPESLLDNVIWLTPRDATRGGGLGPAASLTLSPEVAKAQRTGGTWSEIFNLYSLRNEFGGLAALVWWLLLLLLGWSAWPLLYKALPNFLIRGYGLARLLGLLVWAYLGWLLASLHLLPSVGWSQWLILGIMLCFACWWYWHNRTGFFDWIHTHWREMLRVDIIFTVLFVIWTIVRAQNPDLWHPVTGGEKPMDFAFFNAIIKSTWFPPYDPWFSGGAMNYYYFGFVLFSTMSEALGIIPSIAYNLAIPSLYAFTGVGAYTLAANMIKGDARLRHRTGLWGVLIVLVLGNYGELQLLLKGFSEIGGVEFDSLIPGYPQFISAVVGFYKFLAQGVSLNFRPEWWYWNASRVIPYVPGEVGAINEFPGFSFLYGDLHAHAMALPLTQLALAVALHWAGETFANITRTRTNSLASRAKTIIRYVLPEHWQSLVIGVIAVGALRATNTWDYPTYLALMALAMLFPLIFPGEDPEQTLVRDTSRFWRLGAPALLVLLAEIAYRPFSQNYVSAYLSVESWTGSTTPLSAYFIMHGQFLIPLVISAIYTSWQVIHLTLIKRERDGAARNGYQYLVFVLFGLSLALFMTVLILRYKAHVVWVTVPLGALSAVLLLSNDRSREERFRWLLVGTSMALSIFVEIFVLKGDIGRMNTVFKFYLQVWMLLGICTAVTVSKVLNSCFFAELPPGRLQNATRFSTTGRPKWLEPMLVAVIMLSVATSALYPLLAIPAKIEDRWAPDAPTTLDGSQFMRFAVQYEHGSRIPLEADYRVIRWMQQSIEGSPVIMEQQGEREYLWGGRISVYTGLPAVASWRWHSVQQRLVMPGGTVEARQNDVRLFYLTTSAELARMILERYDVSYVVLAPYDIAYTLPEGLAKFDAMVQLGWLNPVYADGESVVYKVAEK